MVLEAGPGLREALLQVHLEVRLALPQELEELPSVLQAMLKEHEVH